jgi:hypothetical protein
MAQAQSLIYHLYFDGSNYTYWKVHMKAFLKSLDKNVGSILDTG